MTKYIFAILAILTNSLMIVATDYTSYSEIIKINPLPKSLVLQALFARAVASGKVVTDVDATVTSISIAQASSLIREEAGYIAILNGRKLYLDLRTDSLNTQPYNEIYGYGVAQQVIAGLQAKIKW